MVAHQQRSALLLENPSICTQHAAHQGLQAEAEHDLPSYLRIDMCASNRDCQESLPLVTEGLQCFQQVQHSHYHSHLHRWRGGKRRWQAKRIKLLLK